MNKKIKQFSEQAIHDDNGETLHFLPNPRYIEKFSNLIIQECINEVSQYHSTTIYDGFIPENPTREHYEEWAYIRGNNTGYNDAAKQIADGLKEHFGVK